MTRRYHGSTVSHAYHRPDKAMAQPRSIAYHGHAHSYNDGHESDEYRRSRGEKRGRKRNSIACARCRKRKIKCTGDQHDGKGCEACQIAGTAQTTCHYLRVMSHRLDDVVFQSSADSEWPFSGPAPASYPLSTNRSTTDPSQYALANGNIHSSVAVPFVATPYSSAPPRHPFPTTNYHATMENNYDMQRVQHNLPLQFSQAPPATHYSGPDGFQHWSPLQLNDRSTASGFMYDPDSSSRYSGSTIPYMNSTNASVPTITAGSTAFPGLSPLVTHLPTHEMNRTLPNPSSIHSPYEGSDISNHDNDGDTVSFHQGLGKSRESWGLGRTIAGTSQGSVSSASQENVCASGPASSTSSSSPEESQDVATFGYMPLSQTTSNAPSTSPSDFRSMHPPLTARSLNNYGEASHSNRQGNHGLPCLNSPFDMYGVQGGVDDTHHDRSDSLSSGLAILNGQPRPRIIHPQPRPSPSYELLKGTFEGGASIPHRGLK